MAMITYFGFHLMKHFITSMVELDITFSISFCFILITYI